MRSCTAVVGDRRARPTRICRTSRWRADLVADTIPVADQRPAGNARSRSELPQAWCRAPLRDGSPAHPPGLVVNSPWRAVDERMLRAGVALKAGFVPGRLLGDGTGDSRHPKGVSARSQATVWEESVWETSRPRRQEVQVRVCRVRPVACRSDCGTTPRIAGRIVGRSS